MLLIRSARCPIFPKGLGISSRVPGFFKDSEGSWSFPQVNGLLVPIRNVERQIVGLQIRSDASKPFLSISGFHRREKRPVVAQDVRPTLVYRTVEMTNACGSPRGH